MPKENPLITFRLTIIIRSPSGKQRKMDFPGGEGARESEPEMIYATGW